MLTVKFETDYGWMIKEAEEVRVGSHSATGDPLVSLWNKGEGAFYSLVVTFDRDSVSENEDQAVAAYVENANGHTVQVIRPTYGKSK